MHRLREQVSSPLKVAIAGCGLIGHKRAAALGGDRLVACFDPDENAATAMAEAHGVAAVKSLDELLAHDLDAVVVATPHDRLAETAIAALRSGVHVLVEKPAGIGRTEVDAVDAAARDADRVVKVGFNHRFAPGIARAVAEARSGRFGEVMFARARYGHGGRIGYEQEWRLDPARSGGGELVDQGMHLIDLFHWLLGPLPLHSALLRTHFWDAPVEDNAVFTLADAGDGPWASAHVTWTEWKNLFSLEIYCRTGKLQVDGLTGSYGPQRLAIHAMKPELGPPESELIEYPADDVSWEAEWEDFRAALGGGTPNGDLGDARYAWGIIEEAYARHRR
jgi:predicted dehydrogenase